MPDRGRRWAGSPERQPLTNCCHERKHLVLRRPFEPAGCSGEPVVTTVCYLHFAHGLRVQRAPGVSCALLRVACALFLRGAQYHANLGRITPRERERMSTGCLKVELFAIRDG